MKVDRKLIIEFTIQNEQTGKGKDLKSAPSHTFSLGRSAETESAVWLIGEGDARKDVPKDVERKIGKIMWKNVEKVNKEESACGEP